MRLDGVVRGAIRSGSMAGSERVVSVVVAFRDARRTLPSCVQSLCSQAVPGWRVEIALVDDGSTDGGVGLVRDVPGVTTLREAWSGPYVARNKGVRATSGSVVAFTDADCVAADGWLAALLGPFGDPAVHLVLGRRVAPARSRPLALLLEYEHARDAYVLGGERPELYYGHTNNMAVRRETLERLGPFVEGMRGSDTVLVRRVVDAHSTGSVVYCPSAVVTHLELGGLRAYYGKVFTYGRHRRLTAALGTADPLSTADRLAVAETALAAVGGEQATRLELGALLGVGAAAWWLGSLTAYAPLHFGRSRQVAPAAPIPLAEHPPPLLEDPHDRPVRGEAVDVHLRPTDHQVDVDRRDVDPGGEPAVVVE
jgi:GT2 family glycosyltransferase